ncbi:hypothetical protein A1OE_1408 [Candidatus Endolissoclinum faulkneri L2]|uniref:DUF374 domain-containing protein n=1 Tax=Candidatus Endolissoclinum faulkneri L2 TaxID=1193729 RepID=K7YPV9_9PROT|nr:lysophospholipid acyltransferase family protein [Candidatus Endolissoclinum faulkneri]AFX99577.1 hypothetical protein A1OE_1408 [Candidatus Endolissoclinum faulkneri L2]
MLKSIVRSYIGYTILTKVTRAYIRMLFATINIERYIDQKSDAIITSGEPFLVIFWHNRLGLIPSSWPRGKPLAMLHSSHSDGRMISEAMSDFITLPIEGSTRRKPMNALRGMLRALKKGYPVAITPDGPRGPRMRCQPGVIEVARYTGIPVLPFTCSLRPCIQIASWDRFLFPLPFTNGVVMIGAPIHLTKEDNREQARLLVEGILTNVTNAADHYLGMEPTAPDPPQQGVST